ncbi:MAG: hypothetical protein JWO30_3378 [Fibrobacteres bacterium]|nr:hypothetical protein [Fibrobacterota bacterium]
MESEIDAYLQKSIEFENIIVTAGEKIRSLSKNVYGDLSVVRHAYVAALHLLFEKYDEKSGDFNKERSDILTVLCAYLQGIGITEHCISEGQYLKAAAVLKQDYEMVAKIGQIKKGIVESKRVPNAKHAPHGTQRFYGEINGLAHPSSIGQIQSAIVSYQTGAGYGTSFVPGFDEGTAKNFFRWHIWSLFEMSRIAFILFDEIFPGEQGFKKATLYKIMTAVEIMKKNGFMELK